MKKITKSIILVLCAVLVYSFVTLKPAKAASKVPTQEEIDKTKAFVEKSLKINPDGSYSINKKEALKIYTAKELKNVENTFKLIGKDTLSKIYNQYGSTSTAKENPNLPDTTTYFVPAIPIIAFTVWDLLTWLGATGAAAIAAAFAKDMYTHGVKSACKKFATKHSQINKWCYHNGYL